MNEIENSELDSLNLCDFFAYLMFLGIPNPQPIKEKQFTAY